CRFPCQHGLRGRTGLFLRTADARRRIRGQIPDRRRRGGLTAVSATPMVDGRLMRPLKLTCGAIRIFHLFPLASPRERDGSRRARRRRQPINREWGYGEVVDIAEAAVVRRASNKDATRTSGPIVNANGGLTPLADISALPWRALAERAVEPNGYYLPDWELEIG